MGRFWKMNVFFLRLAVVERILLINFWHQFEYHEVNHFSSGLLYWPLCSVLVRYDCQSYHVFLTDGSHWSKHDILLYVFHTICKWLGYISRFAILVLLSGFHSQWMLEHPKVLSCWWVSECWFLLGSGVSSWVAHICTPTVSIPFLLLIVDASGSHLPHGIYPRLYVPHHRTLRWRFVGRTPGSTTEERRKCSTGWVTDGKKTIICFCDFLSIFIEKATGKTGWSLKHGTVCWKDSHGIIEITHIIYVYL